MHNTHFLLYAFKVKNMLVCVLLCIHMCGRTCICVNVGVWKLNVNVVHWVSSLISFPPYYLKQDLSLNLKLVSWLDWLTSKL